MVSSTPLGKLLRQARIVGTSGLAGNPSSEVGGHPTKEGDGLTPKRGGGLALAEDHADVDEMAAFVAFGL